MQKLLNYNYLYLVPLILSAAASLRSFRLARLRHFRGFSIFLLISSVVELFAIEWKWSLHKTAWWSYSTSNLWIYNAFLVLRVLFYLWFYERQLTSQKIKKMIRASAVPLTLFGLVNYLFIETPHVVNNYSLVPYYIIIMLLAVGYFIQVLKDPVIVKLTSQPMVWVSLGTLLYYATAWPFFLYLPYLNKDDIALAYSLLYINTSLNTIMYTFYLISFLCKPSIQQ